MAVRVLLIAMAMLISAESAAVIVLRHRVIGAEGQLHDCLRRNALLQDKSAP